MAGKVAEYNRAKAMHQLYLRRQEQRANDVLNSLSRADLGRDIALHEANADYYTSEAGYQDAAMGRMRMQSASQIREMQLMRTANFNMGVAELGEYRAGLRRSAGILAAQATLYRQQTADFATARRLGDATFAARSTQNAAEQAAMRARYGITTAGATLLTQRRAGLTATRARIGGEHAVATRQMATATAQRGLVRTQQAQRDPVFRSRLATIEAGRATNVAQMGLQGEAARQRRMGRQEAFGAEVGAAEVSGAARGFTGSFQQLREAEAEQALTRDLRLYAMEDAVERSRLLEEQQQLAQAEVDLRAEDRIKRAQLGVEEQQARTAQKQAALLTLRADESLAGLNIEGGRIGVAAAEQAAERKVVDAGLRRLEANAKDITEQKDALRARTTQGAQAVAVREAERTGTAGVLTAQQEVARKRNALISAQSQAVGEQVQRAQRQLTEELAVAGLAKAKTLLSARRERREAGRKELEQRGIDEEVWLQDAAEVITRWQIANLPSADEYEKAGNQQSDVMLLLSGIASWF